MDFRRQLEWLPPDKTAASATCAPRGACPASLERFWKEVGAGYFGGLAFHVFGDGPEPYHDLRSWNVEAMESWRWLVPAEYLAFAEDAFGTQFLYSTVDPERPALLLLPQDAEVLEVGSTFADFFDQLATEETGGKLVNFAFYIDCLVNDVAHAVGNHLTLKVARRLGGHEGLGLVDVDAVTNMAYLGQLTRQVQPGSVKPGDRVRFKLTDG